MDTFISHSPQDTEMLGVRWGESAPARLVIGLGGELGAGKTQLVRGLARGLGCSGRVHSPTFALINEYPGGRWPLHHLDLYRLETWEEIESAGLGEYLDSPPGIAAVEWMEKWRPEEFQNWIDRGLAPTRLMVPLRLVRIETLSELERRIVYEDFGT